MGREILLRSCPWPTWSIGATFTDVTVSDGSEQRGGLIDGSRSLPLAGNLPTAAPMLDWVVRLAYRAERRFKSLLGLHQRGVQAIAFTPDGQLLLVSLRYVPGWHLPGGGVKKREGFQDAVLREMREETGMESFAGMRSLGIVEEVSSGVPTTIEIFRLDGVRLSPKSGWSLEVRQVRAWDPADLPPQCAVARKRLKLLDV
jgi:ADP-ribose pyrophosphatase YjhB (NUDIX family)